MADHDKKFRCPCCDRNEIDPRVEALHREIEEDIGQKLIVTSGFRCPKHNKEVGGSATSSHLKGLAWDVAVDNSRLRYRVIQSALTRGITRIGVGKGFLHLDIDRAKDQRVIWLY
jgi:uncharacterized protein YcbK (DUF882 family)